MPSSTSTHSGGPPSVRLVARSLTSYVYNAELNFHIQASRHITCWSPTKPRATASPRASCSTSSLILQKPSNLPRMERNHLIALPQPQLQLPPLPLKLPRRQRPRTATQRARSPYHNHPPRPARRPDRRTSLHHSESSRYPPSASPRPSTTSASA